MDIQPGRPASSVRVLTLDQLSKGEGNTLQKMQNDASHNIFFTPGVAPILAKQRVTTAAELYGLGTRTVFYPASAPVNDKGLLNGEGKLVLDIADILTSTKPTELWAQQVPNVAALMPGVNIIVGAVGCYDKLSHTGLRKRIGGGICFADIVVKTLLLLGNFIPGLQHMANWLIVVQIVIKVGDKYVEYKFNAREEQGRAIWQGVQVSALTANRAMLPPNGLGMLASDGPSASILTQKKPPAL
jgi:hypothetical protein